MRKATLCSLLVLLLGLTSASGQTLVATFHRVNQTGPIGPITIYTPTDWAMYRVSISMVLAFGNGDISSRWESDLRFKNEAGQSDLFLSLPVNVPQNALAEFPIHAQAGKPISITVNSIGTTSRSKYNIWIAVEKVF